VEVVALPQTQFKMGQQADQAEAAVLTRLLLVGAEVKAAPAILLQQVLHRGHVAVTEIHLTAHTDQAAQEAQVKQAKHQTTPTAMAVTVQAVTDQVGQVTAQLMQVAAAAADTTVTHGTVSNQVEPAVADKVVLKANQHKTVQPRVVAVVAQDTLLTLTQLVLLD
jgi:hypothetical protein